MVVGKFDSGLELAIFRSPIVVTESDSLKFRV